jgi:O-antigen/teichoic acid export membrane protein
MTVRLLSVETYGAIKLVTAVTASVSALCLGGLAEPLMKSAANAWDGNFRIVGKVKLRAYLFASLVLGLIAGYYRFHEHQFLVAGILLTSAVIFPALQAQEIWQAWGAGRGWFHLLSLWSSTVSVAGVLVVAILYFLKLSNGTLFYLATQLPWIVVTLFAIRYILKTLRNTTEEPTSIRFGYHVSLASIAGIFLSSDRILLNHYWDETLVAKFAVISILPEQSVNFFRVINQLWTPKGYQTLNARSFWNSEFKRLATTQLIFTIGSLLAFVLIPLFFGFLFSEKYADLAHYAAELTALSTFVVPVALLGLPLRAKQNRPFIYAFNVSIPVLGLILNAWAARYGLEAVVRAREVMLVYGTLLYIGFFSWEYRRNSRA